MSKKLFSLLLCFFAIAIGTASAQALRVSGDVTDSSTGESIPFSSVMVKGTMNGVSADADGNYSIMVGDPSSDVLVFSAVGYATQEIAVNGRAHVSAALESDNRLDDVIVVAYGTVRREANTGSVQSLKSEELATAPVTSVDKMLAGKMAGVSLSSYSGQPGSTTSIRIRGTSSINAGNEPLWVVDGIPIITSDNRISSNYGTGGGSSTAFLNPNDIESITVLKDAAAASVYGSRAANGVILVTTKSGKSGQAKFTARVKLGAQQLANDNNYRPMTGSELVEYWRTAAVNAGHNPDDPSDTYYTPTSLAENCHDWYKDLTRIGMLQEYEINATGGNDRASYYASLSYHSNEGVYYATDYDRFSARVNADYTLRPNLKTGARVNVSYNNSDSGAMGASYYGNPAQAMFGLLPWTPMYNEDGSFSKPSENSGYNPRANAAYDENNDKEYRFNGSMYLEWKPIKKLTLKTTDSAEASFLTSRQYSSDKADPSGQTSLYTAKADELRLTTSNTATYDDKFGLHSVRVLAGQEAMVDTYEAMSVSSPNVNPDLPWITTGTTATDAGGYRYQQYSLLSFFGVADYNYDNKYFFQASVRADGSSLFGADNKWGVFWSASGSWNITKEKFMQSTSDWLSQLKLRVSYGVNGNNNISAYRAYGVYAASHYNSQTTMTPSRPDNPNLSWEKNKTWNVGVDFSFFNDRLSGSVDVYNRLTDDMLLSKSTPYTTGFGSNFMNTGSIRNRGVEFMLDGLLYRKGDWNWSAGFNIAFNRSKVLDLAGSGFLTAVDPRTWNDREYKDTPVRIVEGMSLYNFYIREYAGVNPATGEGLFVTEDGSLTSDRSQGRWIYAGSPEPKFTGGFNTELSWKGLSLSAYFEFVYGNKVMTGNWFTTDGENAWTSNCVNTALNYWKKPGDTGVLPKPIAGGSNVWYAGYSTRFLEDGSYLRVKDVTLSYTLPSKIANAVNLGGIKVYVSALNPYTFHHVNGLDPDLGPIGYAYGGNHTAVKSFVGGVEVSF